MTPLAAVLLGCMAGATAVALPAVSSPRILQRTTETVRIEQLDESLLPTGDRRLIFIGDIHGCKDKLLELLDDAEYNQETDHIVAVGDIVNKGPDTLGVIDYLMSQNASSVRGNHEERIVPLAEAANITEAYDNPNSSPEAIAQALSPAQLSYLQSFPHILRIGTNLPTFRGETIVAHAGLVPGLALEAQVPDSVMNMRALDTQTLEVSNARAEAGSLENHWFVVWDEHQFWYSLTSWVRKLLGKDKAAPRATVIYGHDSRLGLQLGSYHRGLDTRCSAGGYLTALVVSDGGAKEAIVTVDCPNYEEQVAES
ncbi:uncharacterized protein HMPREF1541_07923 [Cyphellophora europaea CBS 101466]|uniref:Calcineurin-like phosphoesterase domain-containing protein n=1 Tax=Cyphellophora europaea (strain CBS 101466) TaxID=1220924 RepID=W2RKF0_CYPE1|nr:uncharacterized protein HMPREF1541_07923 [Cyphellophora europaea CBS 101466]ETN36936.1 hypothetical protein HMPREF1541_07923 [Cyphellophora europaea CBS 101466]